MGCRKRRGEKKRKGPYLNYVCTERGEGIVEKWIYKVNNLLNVDKGEGFQNSKNVADVIL